MNYLVHIFFLPAPPSKQMTCFWKGFMNCLSDTDVQFSRGLSRLPQHEHEFVHFLQKNNIRANDVSWQHQPVSSRLQEESFQAVKALESNTIGEGYWCSTCDPFILLISQLFQIDVHHRFCGHLVVYSVPHPRKTIYVTSDRGHLQQWKASTIHNVSG